MNKLNMTKWALVLVAAPLLAGCVYQQPPPPPPPPGGVATSSSAEIAVTDQTPPPPEVEVVPAAPGSLDAWYWVPGQWVWRGRWVWVGGHWGRRPHPGAVWVHGGWVWRHHHRAWVEGYWR